MRLYPNLLERASHMLHHVASRRAPLNSAPLCPALRCSALLSLLSAPCSAITCRALPRHATPCHAMLRHATPCHAMPCHATQGRSQPVAGRRSSQPSFCRTSARRRPCATCSSAPRMPPSAQAPDASASGENPRVKKFRGFPLSGGIYSLKNKGSGRTPELPDVYFVHGASQ